MMTRRASLNALAALSFMAHAVLIGQGVSGLSGRVIDNTQHSAPNLQVRLRPPQNSAVKVQIALTDANGGFTFPALPGGRYLMEVSQGPYVYFRQQITLPAAAMTITIQRH